MRHMETVKSGKDLCAFYLFFNLINQLAVEITLNFEMVLHCIRLLSP